MSGGGFYASKAAAAAAGGGDAGSERVAGADLPLGVLRKLETLSYPHMQSASLSGSGYCKVVLWLEEEKIRLYQPKARQNLREFNEAWHEHAAKYAKELGIKVDGLTENDFTVKKRVLNELVNLAISDVYRDRVESKEILLAAPSGPVALGGGQGKQQLAELIVPANKLLEHFSLPKISLDAVDTDVIAALRCIKTRLCAAGSGARVELNLDELPFGVDIADPDVRQAAGVLRLLHGIEMQQLQVNINHVMNDLQMLTANPKVDSRLGKVGT